MGKSDLHNKRLFSFPPDQKVSGRRCRLVNAVPTLGWKLSLHVLGLPLGALRWLPQPTSLHWAFGGKKLGALERWACHHEFSWDQEGKVFCEALQHSSWYIFLVRTGSHAFNVDHTWAHLPWDQSTPTWNKTKSDSATKGGGEGLRGVNKSLYAQPMVSSGLSVCVSLPRTPTLFARGASPTQAPALASAEPQQRWMSSRRAQTLGRVMDYYVIDSLDLIRADPPGQALFIFVLSTSWIQHYAQHIVGLLKSICWITVELIFFLP